MRIYVHVLGVVLAALRACPAHCRRTTGRERFARFLLHGPTSHRLIWLMLC